MSFIEIIILSIGLAMDAFAVSICKGLGMKKVTVKNELIVGGYFGIFQAIMPLIGYFIGVRFQEKITAIDHWIAFILLSIIGVNMIRESLGDDEDDEENESDLGFKTMIVLAIATSIDALAVGITLAFLKVNIITSAITIGILTMAISIIGVRIGNVFGTKYKSKAELAGGIILICIGLKILLQHLGIF